MKANEAPEKIYVADATFPDYVDFDGSPINTKRIDNHDIEYIRADAFIEKAERYIRSVADGLDRDDDVETFISDFRKYMKGENE